MAVVPIRPVKLAGKAAGFLFWLVVCSALAQSEDAQRAAQETQTRQKLDQVRIEIKRISDMATSTQSARADIAKSLREQELKISGLVRELRALEQKMASQQAELARLDKQRTALNLKLDAERESLAALLRSAYALGRNEELKLWLAQDDAQAVSRVLAYHRYFQRARIEQIGSLVSDLAELANVQQAIETQNAELNATRTERTQQVTALESDRKQREQMLDELLVKLKDQQSILAALGKDEKGLVELLEKLRDVFADIPKQIAGAVPFAELRGRLSWPLRGALKTAFGANDENDRASQGVLIQSKRGSEVHAVSHGRVAFADWLRGFGLLLILDHGDGYLTLYGYNETLLKDVGDWVNANEAIATSGASGSGKVAGLYFELRYQGKPQNPRMWFKADSVRSSDR